MAKSIFTDEFTAVSDSEREKKRAERQQQIAEKRELEEKRREAKTKRAKAINKAMIIGLVVILLAVALFGRLFVQINRLRQEKEAAEENLSRLQQQIDELEETLENVTSPEYIESEARSKLRMIYPNEVMYIVEDGEE